jgi:hypothetical protein
MKLTVCGKNGLVNATTRPLSTYLATAAAASAGAGLVHAAAAGGHSDEPTLAWLFALCAVAQLGWAALLVFRPHRLLVAAGVLLNAGCIAVWALTRITDVGGPFGSVEEVGFQDSLAALLAAIAVIGGTVALVGRNRTARHLDAPAIGVACLLVLVLAVPAMAATHTHGAGHSHDDGAVVVAADGGHTHADSTSTSAHSHATAAGEAPTGPIIALDDPRLTSEQRARGTTLLDDTRLAMAFFPNEAAVVAAGYQSIGDGRVSAFEHFVNSAYMTDGRELDPHAIESIVLQRQPDGTKKVASAMYILNPGRTLADAPDIAGPLSSWHDHQNLCWNDAGHIAGILVNGVCRPGGTFRGTSPMLHVWIESTPCGPFSGIEGHGGVGCEHTHTAS